MQSLLYRPRAWRTRLARKQKRLSESSQAASLFLTDGVKLINSYMVGVEPVDDVFVCLGLDVEERKGGGPGKVVVEAKRVCVRKQEITFSNPRRPVQSPTHLVGVDHKGGGMTKIWSGSAMRM